MDQPTSETKAQILDINSALNSWMATRCLEQKVKVNKVVQASNNGDTIRAEAPEKFVPAIGSVLGGGQARDIVEGRIERTSLTAVMVVILSMVVTVVT